MRRLRLKHDQLDYASPGKDEAALIGGAFNAD